MMFLSFFNPIIQRVFIHYSHFKFCFHCLKSNVWIEHPFPGIPWDFLDHFVRLWTRLRLFHWCILDRGYCWWQLHGFYHSCHRHCWNCDQHIGQRNSKAAKLVYFLKLEILQSFMMQTITTLPYHPTRLSHHNRLPIYKWIIVVSSFETDNPGNGAKSTHRVIVFARAPEGSIVEVSLIFDQVK